MVPHMFDNTDYSTDIALHFDRSSNRRLPGPGRSGDKFVDDDDLPAVGAILLIEIAAFEEARAYGGEIARRNRPKISGGRGILLRRGSLWTIRTIPIGQILIERQVGNTAHTFHAGYRGECAFPFRDSDKCGRTIAYGQLEGKHVARFKTRPDLFYLGECPDSESGAGD